jgi:excisionase family DNA binding protein
MNGGLDEMENPTEILTVSDVATEIGVTPQTVVGYANAGKLPAQRTRSGVRLFRLDDVKRFIVARHGNTKEAATNK